MAVNMGDKYLNATAEPKGILVRIQKNENIETEPIIPLKINNELFLPTNDVF